MAWRSFGAIVAAAALAGCVQTRQYADVEFNPPAGDYDLIVMRPSVSVGSITTGGLIEPREDWTEQARANVLAALRQQQAAHGGRATILESRDGIEGVSPAAVAELERLFNAVGSSIILHRYMGYTLPTKRRQGIDWTLGEDAVAFGEATGMEYALFLAAEDSVASSGRVALQVLGIAGCFVGFCAPSIPGAKQQQAYAALVDLRTGEVVWFNILNAQFGDIRTPEGATQMVDRLIGRMQPGREARQGEVEVDPPDVPPPDETPSP